MQLTGSRTAILDEESVKRKIRRMALEVAEQNAGEKELVIAGIAGNGETVARCIADEVMGLLTATITVIRIQLDKQHPFDVVLEPALDLHNKNVLIVDDVANTGRILFYALKPFLLSSPRRLQTLVLVERSHKQFPVHSDFTGLSVSTTLQEHIEVETEGEKILGAWLY